MRRRGCGPVRATSWSRGQVNLRNQHLCLEGLMLGALCAL